MKAIVFIYEHYLLVSLGFVIVSIVLYYFRDSFVLKKSEEEK